MNKIFFPFLITLFTINSVVKAEGFIKKEVYSFKDKNGNTVFTDRQPTKSKTFKTKTIEAVNSTANTQYTYIPQLESNQTNISSQNEQVVRVVIEDGNVTKKKSYKKKRSLKRCKSFKRKFDYYSDRLKSGYKNKEYKMLEKNRKKYRNLLFKNCETRTFDD